MPREWVDHRTEADSSSLYLRTLSPQQAIARLRFLADEAQNLDEAAAFAKKAIKHCPPDQMLIICVAEIFEQNNDRLNAGATLLDGVKLFRSKLLFDACAEHFYREEDFEKFLPFAMESLRLKPWQYSLLKKVAKAHTALGQLKEAAFFYNVVHLVRATRLRRSDSTGANGKITKESHDETNQAFENTLSIVEAQNPLLADRKQRGDPRDRYVQSESDFDLLSYSTRNIGDDIQSLAALGNIGRVHDFVDRDNLNGSQSTNKIILNGWFAHQTKASRDADALKFSWPPSSSLQPLFVSFHLADKAAPFLLTAKGIRYLKKHQPIGCRDHATQALLEKCGIKTEFTGCLTLTLDERKTVPRDGYVAISDMPKNLSRSVKEYFEKSQDVPAYEISHALSDEVSCPVKRLRLAEDYLNFYAGARFVLTTRLHAALPCIAMGVPVLLATPARDDRRFGGLLQCINTLELELIERDLTCLIEYMDEVRKDHLHIKSALQQKISDFAKPDFSSR